MLDIVPKWLAWFKDWRRSSAWLGSHGVYAYASPDSKIHGANMGPTWGRQDPGGPHVNPHEPCCLGIYRSNTMVADDLATEEVRESTPMVFCYFSLNVPASTPYYFTFNACAKCVVWTYTPLNVLFLNEYIVWAVIMLTILCQKQSHVTQHNRVCQPGGHCMLIYSVQLTWIYSERVASMTSLWFTIESHAWNGSISLSNRPKIKVWSKYLISIYDQHRYFF